MKFGRDLKQSVVPEWEANYCNYNELKQHLKTISSEANPSPLDHTNFFLAVVRARGSFLRSRPESRRRGL